MQNPMDTNITTISTSALLFEMSFSVWTGRKQDKNATREVTNNKKAAKDAASVTKYLMAGTDKLNKIVSFTQQVRQWVNENTLPWSDTGVRLLPAAQFVWFKDELNLKEQQYDALVQDFLNDYQTLVSAAAFKLGDMFNRSEYPDVRDITHKFGMAYSFSPVPTKGDFRVNMNNETVTELQNKYEKYLESKVNSAMRDAWDRLYNTLTHMSTHLGVDEFGKKRKFHASAIEGATELCGLLTKFNITNDSKLEAMRKELENVLFGVDATEIKKREGAREELKSRVDELLGKFGEEFSF